ncbi:MAG TPA: peptidylprolyl isomerase [Gemmatimonadales bacterium]|nr:peptidylprolyl isomerase [Gemmatimonadales bacterium]
MTRPFPLPILGALLLGTAACSSSPSLDEARAATVVDVDGVTLDGATLESILREAPPNAGPSQETARLVTSAFIDAALFRKALLNGTSLTDSATLARIIEPDAIRGMVRQHMIQLARGYPVPTDAEVDSVTRLGQVRSFQAIGVRLAPPDDSAAMARMRTKVEAARTEALQGGDFTALVRRYSEDTSFVQSNGYLPALQRGQLPPTPSVAAMWRLEYDQVGAPMALGNMAIIPRRTKVEEARPVIRNWLIPVQAGERNEAWLDSVRSARHLTLAKDAIPRMRDLVREPLDGGGAEPLVTWEGGALSPDQARLWVSVLPPAERAVLPGIADSALTILLTEVADRYVIRDLVNGGDSIPAAAWEAMLPQFRTALASLDSAYRPMLAGADANQAVRDFLRGVTSGKVPYRPLPGAMVWVLRQGASITIDQPAIDVIVTAVMPAWGARRDSLAALDSTAPR